MALPSGAQDALVSRPNRGHLQVRRQTPEGQAGVKPDIGPQTAPPTETPQLSL